LHTQALRIGTHFLLTLETVVFLFHLLSTTSKPFSSLSTKLAHAGRLGFFYKKNALYKLTVIIRGLLFSRRRQSREINGTRTKRGLQYRGLQCRTQLQRRISLLGWKTVT